jgi:acyl dehydratase
MVNMDEMKKFNGNKGKPTHYEIDKTMIKRYCEAIGDLSPRWHDRVPPGLLTAAMLMGDAPQMPPFVYPGIVDAGGDWEYFKPIKAGDTLTVVNEFTGVEDKSNEKRKMLLFSMSSTFTNQKGEVVARTNGRIMNLG